MRDIADVSVSDKSAKSLAILSKWRNALQHYGLKANARAIESRAAQVLDFLIAFVHQELILTLEEEQQEAIDAELEAVSAKVLSMKSVIQARLNRLAEELKDVQDLTLKCPECDQWAVVIGTADVAECHFCHATWWGPQEVLSYVFHHEGSVDLVMCPECGHDGLARNGVLVAAAPEEYRIFCGCCGHHFDAIDICASCSAPYEPTEDDLGMCSDCVDARYAKF